SFDHTQNPGFRSASSEGIGGAPGGLGGERLPADKALLLERLHGVRGEQATASRASGWMEVAADVEGMIALPLSKQAPRDAALFELGGERCGGRTLPRPRQIVDENQAGAEHAANRSEGRYLVSKPPPRGPARLATVLRAPASRSASAAVLPSFAAWESPPRR